MCFLKKLLVYVRLQFLQFPAMNPIEGVKVRSNPSQDRSRGFANCQKYMKNMVEVCKVPLLVFYQNLLSLKLECYGDKKSVEIVSTEKDFLKKFDYVLSSSVASGEEFTFMDIKHVESGSSSVSSGSEKCPLPKLKYKMFTE